MNIGIIGSGMIGGTLGPLWAKAGHRVLYASRHPETLAGLAHDTGHGARAGTPAEAAAFGGAVLLAIPFGATPDLGKTLGSALRGKVVLDVGWASRLPGMTWTRSPSPSSSCGTPASTR